MREIALFVEDFAHQQIIGPLVERIAREQGVAVRLDWRSAVRGHGRVVRELGNYLRDVDRQGEPKPHLIVVATDANCSGLNERAREIEKQTDQACSPVVLAVPDPHVERWLLLDGAAFKAVFGQGCDAPDRKCDRDRYKQRLVEAIRGTGVTPSVGGIEYAEDIVRKMDFDRAMQADRSFARFVDGLRAELQSPPPEPQPLVAHRARAAGAGAIDPARRR